MRFDRPLSTLALLILLVMSPGAFAGLFSGSAPTDLGARDGKLKACPSTPNCVASQGSPAAHWIAPLAFAGEPAAALARVRAIVESTAGARVVEQKDGYLRAEYKSAFFGFVDDVEFLVDAAARVIHVRSASRIGRSDFGANRERIEALRLKLAG